ncbi:LytS/YhcK type 5TM receptor domain-containing protein [Mesorhizobium tamadayense]|uniref:LytS/YhcK type 5TM receptor domain-containing protein n=1 Tax=Mesorhizobium tamadayense TaxID=425306 RepID=UPI001FE18F4C|nr:hypothetical protein [Mesorhizobium tamadayense]
MTEIWHSLLANLALVSILVVAWDLVADFTGRLRQRVQSLLLGLVMCAGSIISMATALSVSGFVVDLRAAFVGAAAFFGGWPACSSPPPVPLPIGSILAGRVPASAS